MAFVEGSNDGTLNGTSEVTLVAAPASATRRIVKNINISNIDTAAVTVTLQLAISSTRRTIYKVTLAAGDTLNYESVIVLDATTKSVIAKMSGAAATTNPDFVTSYGDAT
jgi:hypothetical protein